LHGKNPNAISTLFAGFEAPISKLLILLKKECQSDLSRANQVHLTIMRQEHFFPEYLYKIKQKISMSTLSKN
jgi:hypothetical protein